MTLEEPTVLCVIPARAGSTRIPGKNMKMFHGKPIIQYSIEKAQESGLFTDIVVTSDSTETLDFIVSLGAIAHLRPTNLAHNDVGTQEVAREVLEWFDDCQTLCVIYATAPLMSVEDLRRGKQLLDTKGLDYVYAGGEHPPADAGQFYWCKREPVLERRPLTGLKTWRLLVTAERVCDINTPQDWARAEAMFLNLEKAIPHE